MSSLRQISLLSGFILIASPALAAKSSCPGVMRASLVHPLPAQLTVSTARNINDMSTPELAFRFLQGLEQAGVAVVPQGGSATLSVAISVVAPNPATGVVSGTYKGFEWTSGEPRMTGHGAVSIRNSRLSISAVLADDAAVTQSWIATIDCTVQTEDAGELAEYIGNTLGRMIGRNIDRTGT